MAKFLLKDTWIVILIIISSMQYSDGFLFSFLNASYKLNYLTAKPRPRMISTTATPLTIL